MSIDGGDQLILATAGYDHTIKIWQAHTGNCVKSMQHLDSVIIKLQYYLLKE